MGSEIIKQYLATVQAIYAKGVATEHSYRPALQDLFDQVAKDVTAVNEPRGIEVGRPDFVFQRGPDQITVGHCEAKDIGLAITPKAMDAANKAQFARYTKGLSNLIYTNCLDFHFYQNGERVRAITIAEIKQGLLEPDESQFAALWHQLQDFCAARLQTITSAEKLAEMMAGKAAIIKDVLFNSLKEDEDADFTSDLGGQYKAFKEHLIHDLAIEEFSDIYAETIAYGLFAARLHDKSKDDFSRTEALDLLPQSNPFLKNLFGFVAGPGLDVALRRTIDELAEIFQAVDLPTLFDDFGAFTGRNDPFIHFYETFLAKYNPAKRKARGVWYTPQPVVNFIVRAVDDVLKHEFGLVDGLADTSKITIDWDTGQRATTQKGALRKDGKHIIEKRAVHRVQILDPAAGTGTFLAEVIRQIAPRIKTVAPGHWPEYVEDNLIPRLHGFELLMASYAMCHMKLDMMLAEMGYRPTDKAPRLNVYLTNTLEEGASEPKDLFMAKWLSNEANLANTVKNNTPIMCVIGNPPYAGHSSNKGPWINSLMEAYKQSPELKKPGQAKWLSDDYVKFIRFAEHMIAKNGEGVLGFITNHSYMDNPTFLDMRRHLMETFDTIYILDLHGNAKKKEVAPDGSRDENVFDIQQGVAIIIAVKKKDGTGERAKVFHGDLWGKRKDDGQGKYEALEQKSIRVSDFADVTPKRAPWPFKHTDWALRDAYYDYPSIPDWFSPNGKPAPGIVTTHDEFAISWSAAESREKIETFLRTKNESEARSIWKLCSQKQWNYARAIEGLGHRNWYDLIKPIAYRPFDIRYTVYDPNVAVHRRERVMRHMLRDNLALCCLGQTKDGCGGLAVRYLAGHKVFGAYDISSIFPLYLYPDEQDLDKTRRVNFDDRLWQKMRAMATHPVHGAPDEVAIFDYIYGVLHCPAYRATYAEFLKSDFPRIPWPSAPDMFRDIADKGTQLRRLHLMETGAIGETPYPFIGAGDSRVGKVLHKGTHVCINDTQYFDNVPGSAWNFYIGGYQPAQKWLKDRKGRVLSYDDIRHYQKIIKILVETDRIMNTIVMDI